MVARRMKGRIVQDSGLLWKYRYEAVEGVVVVVVVVRGA